jgi:hypothetical protein
LPFNLSSIPHFYLFLIHNFSTILSWLLFVLHSSFLSINFSISLLP